MKYELANFTYGVELEYGNCDRRQSLPDGATWNVKDNTCVSSTGIANDPKGVLYNFGGEINTRPTPTIIEQIHHIKTINRLIKDSIINYRSNLHVHIRVPKLKSNLEDCKKLLRYVELFQQEAFNIVESIQIPSQENLSDEEYFWQIKRAKRTFKSHQYKLPKKRVMAMLDSKTTTSFYENHAPRTPKGIMWYFSPRAGINLRQMWEDTGTIEFRHFPGTKNPKEIESAIRWCQQFLNAALNRKNVSPIKLLTEYKYQFPRFKPYEFFTEMVYQWTNFDKNTRGLVHQRLDCLRKIIDIDNMKIKSDQVYEVMEKLR